MNFEDTFDYIISAEDGNVVVTKYLNEEEWNEDFNEYFTKTEVIVKTASEKYLSQTIEWMNKHANLGDIWFSSSMDFASECGFKNNGDARNIWERAEDIYKTREFNKNYEKNA